MVVVQARDDRSRPRRRAPARPLRGSRSPTSTIRSLDADVGRGAVEQHCPLNQHDASRLSASSRSTAALSAPSPEAGDGRAPALQCSDVSVGAVIAGVGCGDRGHRQLDQLAAAAAQRLRDCQRRVQAGQRVGDGVAAEHRVAGAAADQPAGYRGVVAERHPVGALAVGAVAGDPQPHPAVASRDVGRAETPVRQRRGPRRLDDDVGGSEQPS